MIETFTALLTIEVDLASFLTCTILLEDLFQLFVVHQLRTRCIVIIDHTKFDFLRVMNIYSWTILDNLVDVTIGTGKLQNAYVKRDKIALNWIVPHVSKGKLELRGFSFKEFSAFPLRIYVHAGTHDQAQNEENNDHQFEHLSVGYQAIS